MKRKVYFMLATMLLCTITGMAQSVTSGSRLNVENLFPVGTQKKGSISRAVEQAGESAAVYIQSFEEGCDWVIIDAANKMTLGKVSGKRPIDGEYNLISAYDQKASRNGWAISTAVSLEQGKSYYISLWCYAPGFDGILEEIEITAGKERTAEAQTTVLMDYTGDKAQEMADWTKVQTTFTPEESGDYYFAIHHCTTAKYVNVTGFDRFYVGTEPDTYVQEVPVPRPTPEGEQLNYMTYFDDVYYGYTEKGGKVVYGEKDSVFIQGIAAQLPRAWVYGIKKGNSIEIPCGQYLGVYTSLSQSIDVYLFAGTDYVPNEKDPRQFGYTPSDNLTLIVEGDNLKTEEGIVVVQAMSKKGTPFSGALNFEMRPFNEKAVSPSASAEKKLYSISYISSKNYDQEVSYMTNVAFSGDTVFIQKASYYMQYMNDSWIYGISNGKTITFPSGQYIGDYIGDGPFPTYLHGATVTGQDEEGDNTYELKDDYVLNIDGDTFSSPDYYVMHLGGIISEACHDLTLTEFDLKPAIPSAINEISYQSVPGKNFVVRYVAEDEDGNRILQDSMYIRVYFDDQLYTFKPLADGGHYKNLTKEMIEIPVGFNDSYDLFGSLSQSRFQFYVYEEFEKLSVEMVYRIGDTVGTSARAVWTESDGFKGTEGQGSLITTGITRPNIDKKIVRTDTYNIYGQPVRADEKGIVIQVDTFNDGSTNTRKALNL